MSTLPPILLVEDNPRDEMLTMRAFRKANIANPIEVVRDGAEAIEFLFATGAHAGRQGAPLPAVVVLDLKLPKMSGLDVLQKVRADPRTALLPVVILTSSDEESDIVSCYREGANSFVQKPIGFPGFSDAIARVGLYWAVVNKLPPLTE